MATPRAAEHRDLEQRLRNLEQQVRELTGAALRRRQLNVTEGDFVVSGGGSVVVEDGGSIEGTYASGRPAVRVGTFDSYDESLAPANVTGVEVDKDADYGSIGHPEIPKVSIRFYRNNDTGEVVAYVDGDTVTVYKGTGELRLGGSGTTQLVLLDAAGDLSLSADTGRYIRLQSLPTTTNAPNLYVDPATSRVYRSV